MTSGQLPDAGAHLAARNNPTRGTRISAAAALLLILSAPASAQAPPAPPLNAKVTERLMGPRTQRIHLSEDGEHIAIVAPKGSREVVLMDGVEGPLFDEIPLNVTLAGVKNALETSPSTNISFRPRKSLLPAI